MQVVNLYEVQLDLDYATVNYGRCLSLQSILFLPTELNSLLTVILLQFMKYMGCSQAMLIVRRGLG